MPINAGFEYFEAEKKFRAAKSAEERLNALHEMLTAIPKHKGTETVVAEINKRIKKTKQEIEKRTEQKRKTSAQSLSVKKEGMGQITIIGLPNVGKSTLLKALTNAEVEIAVYPFTTTKPEIGMMSYEGGQVQLVELPPIIRGSSSGKAQGTELLSIVRNSDGIALLVAGEKPLKEYELIKNELEHVNIKINRERPRLNVQKSGFKGIEISGTENLHISVEEFKEILKHHGYANSYVIVEEKMGKQEIEEALNERLVYKKAVIIAINRGTLNKEELNKLEKKEKIIHIKEYTLEIKQKLARAFFEVLGKILVYTKKPGQTMAQEPLAVKSDANVQDVANTVHKEIAQHLKYGKVWGSTKFGGQRVGKNYKVKHKDVIELYY